jgi:hypothetical protein
MGAAGLTADHTATKEATVSTDGQDPYGADIFTEPEGEADTLANLGPLRPLAGTWEGTKGADDHPVAEGGERNVFLEHYELEPIDRQTNGPQLFYGLRYHTHIVKPGEVETFHDQVGYWLWEPAAGRIIHTLAIPRGQVMMAAGQVDPDATEFEVTAATGTAVYGILSNPFLQRAYHTVSFRLHVTINDDGTWTYEEETVIEVPGRSEPFHHVDGNTLSMVNPPVANPMAAALPSAQLAGGA